MPNVMAAQPLRLGEEKKKEERNNMTKI